MHPSSRRTGDWVRRLERNLRDQIAAEERLLAALDGQQEAMRRLDRDDLQAAIDETVSASTAVEAVAVERARLLGAGAEQVEGTAGRQTRPAARAWQRALETCLE